MRADQAHKQTSPQAAPKTQEESWGKRLERAALRGHIDEEVARRIGMTWERGVRHKGLVWPWALRWRGQEIYAAGLPGVAGQLRRWGLLSQMTQGQA